MKQLSILVLAILCSFGHVFAQNNTTELQDSSGVLAFKYQTGTIALEKGNGKIAVPKGFKFLDAEQAKYVLTDLWGNPPQSDIVGMLVPENQEVTDINGWAFAISYDDIGFVKDSDAKDINYDDMMKDEKKAQVDENKARIQQGYLPIEIVGWASKPFYDENTHTLHWAREMKFGEDSVNTLNYNMRVLGRKGVYVINAIAFMSEFNQVKPVVNEVISSVTFNQGETYKDFDGSMDKVAAYTVGGLVAGKVLAKAGLFALLAKFGKFILIGLVALGGFIMKIFKRKKENEAVVVEEVPVDDTENKNV
ncbi:DUF2167 domain-containing protein [Polluticaenibacter yanchengensis]|uniref:DUF2167 domain-containing protein n=1 Tax=Polluticaenibacter yanchengensis TaxID=3014562 RepID=A0ABT4UFR5_9BACT|nr:DUF2167 domain-containing protein [Chitinophagaceae bacterium LY-5]